MDCSVSPEPGLDARLKSVLRAMPAPVGLVTSFDAEARAPVGLAMTAMMPVSLEPCAMAIAVNRAGSSHEAIMRSGRFCINLLDTALHEHMEAFSKAEARGKRFTEPEWRQHSDIWFIDGAPANIFCTIRNQVGFGTHDILIGEVYHLKVTGQEKVLGWSNGCLGRLEPLREAA